MKTEKFLNVAQGIKVVSFCAALVVFQGCGGGTDSTSDLVDDDQSSPPQVINVPVAGTVGITGEQTIGSVLTVNPDLSDENGLGELSYQWQLNGSDIDGENLLTLTIPDIAADGVIAVTVTFVDGDGFSESVTSQPINIIQLPSVVQKNNVLLIVGDDMGLDTLSLYPYSTDVPPTPNLNALAANGVIFDNVWATPVCTTTRGSLMTGMHGVHSGVAENSSIMDTELDLLPKALKASLGTDAVNTAIFGKWHLAGNNGDLAHPQLSGFDRFVGNMKGSVGNYNQWQQVIDGIETTQTDYHTSVITDAAIEWISQQTNAWFAYVAYASPHTPFHLPPSELHSYDDLSGSDADIDAQPRQYFNAMLESMDTEIGRLLNGMSDEQLANTTVIFMGDNGTGNQVSDKTVFPNRHVKGTLYEGGIRVPMVVSGANVSLANSRVDALINSTDIYSTVLSLMGSQHDVPQTSINFAPLLHSNDITHERTLNYSETVSDRFTGYTVSDGVYKLIVSDEGERQLYHIANDFDEDNNLTGDSALADIENTLVSYGENLRALTLVD